MPPGVALFTSTSSELAAVWHDNIGVSIILATIALEDIKDMKHLLFAFFSRQHIIYHIANKAYELPMGRG